MTTGLEWIIDAYGCIPELLADLPAVQQVCKRVIADLNLRVVGEPQWHQFPPPSGVTGMYLLSESHLTCHTFPESGLATFNLYCCRPRQPWAWEAHLAELLGAEYVLVRRLERGTKLNAVRASERRMPRLEELALPGEGET